MLLKDKAQALSDCSHGECCPFELDSSQASLAALEIQLRCKHPVELVSCDGADSLCSEHSPARLSLVQTRLR